MQSVFPVSTPVHSPFPLQMQNLCIWKAIAGIFKEVLSVFKMFFFPPLTVTDNFYFAMWGFVLRSVE